MAKLKAYLGAQFIMSSIKVIASKRILGSKILSHCKILSLESRREVFHRVLRFPL